jgi:hypothetical protein
MSVKRAQGRERREADAMQRIRRSEGDPFGGPGDVTTFVGAHIWRPVLWTTAFVGSTPIGAVIIGTVAHSYGGRGALGIGIAGCLAAVCAGLLILQTMPVLAPQVHGSEIDTPDTTLEVPK